MPPLRLDFWGLRPQPLLSGLAVLLAAAVLSLVLFPAGHGSFVSTHGPATALRARRLSAALFTWLATLTTMLAGLFAARQVRLQVLAFGLRPPSLDNFFHASPVSAVLLC